MGDYFVPLFFTEGEESGEVFEDEDSRSLSGTVLGHLEQFTSGNSSVEGDEGVFVNSTKYAGVRGHFAEGVYDDLPFARTGGPLDEEPNWVAFDCGVGRYSREDYFKGLDVSAEKPSIYMILKGLELQGDWAQIVLALFNFNIG